MTSPTPNLERNEARNEPDAVACPPAPAGSASKEMPSANSTPDANGWRTDIENAPKNYAPVLLYDPMIWRGCAFEGFHDSDVEMGGSGGWRAAGEGPCNPTHWMPFPKPPVGVT